MPYIITDGTSYCHRTRTRAVEIVPEISLATKFSDRQAAENLLARATKKLKGFQLVEIPDNAASVQQEEKHAPSKRTQRSAAKKTSSEAGAEEQAAKAAADADSPAAGRKRTNRKKKSPAASAADTADNKDHTVQKAAETQDPVREERTEENAKRNTKRPSRRKNSQRRQKDAAAGNADEISADIVQAVSEEAQETSAGTALDVNEEAEIVPADSIPALSEETDELPEGNVPALSEEADELSEGTVPALSEEADELPEGTFPALSEEADDVPADTSAALKEEADHASAAEPAKVSVPSGEPKITMQVHKSSANSPALPPLPGPEDRPAFQETSVKSTGSTRPSSVIDLAALIGEPKITVVTHSTDRRPEPSKPAAPTDEKPAAASSKPVSVLEQIKRRFTDTILNKAEELKESTRSVSEEEKSVPEEKQQAAAQSAAADDLQPVSEEARAADQPEQSNVSGRSQNRRQRGRSKNQTRQKTVTAQQPESIMTEKEPEPAEEQPVFAEEISMDLPSADQKPSASASRPETVEASEAKAPADRHSHRSSGSRQRNSRSTYGRKRMNLPVGEDPDPSRRRMFTQQERNLVYNRTEGHCGICGRFIPLEEYTIDHIIPLSKGGTNDLSNLQACCSFCNKAKDDSLGDEFFRRIQRIYLHQAKLRFSKKQMKKLKKAIKGLYEDD